MPKMIVEKDVMMRHRRVDSFTLIELLVVMAIIAILAALILAAGTGVMNAAARKRASAEIQAMSTALEAYKTDNGIYPPAGDTTFLTNTYSATDGSVSAGTYQAASGLLYTALSGQTNYNDPPLSAGKSYMSFRTSQLGNSTAAAGTAPPSSTYVKDPWGYSYGYSTATNTSGFTPYNGNGSFDLWSTGGLIGAKATNTAAWLSNWTQ